MGAVDSAAADAIGSAELAEKLKRADAGVTGPEPATAAESHAAVTAPGALAIDESRLWIEAAERYGRLVRVALPPEVRAHWTDEALHEFGVELAACAKHYQWKFGGVVTHPLARLAVAGAPLAWPFIAPYVKPYLERFMLGAPPAMAGGSAPAGTAGAGESSGAAATAAEGEAADTIVRVKALEDVES